MILVRIAFKCFILIYITLLTHFVVGFTKCYTIVSFEDFHAETPSDGARHQRELGVLC